MKSDQPRLACKTSPNAVLKEVVSRKPVRRRHRLHDSRITYGEFAEGCYVACGLAAQRRSSSGEAAGIGIATRCGGNDANAEANQIGCAPLLLALQEWSFSYGCYTEPTLLIYGEESYSAEHRWATWSELW